MSEKLKHIKDDEWEAIPNCQKCKAPICMCNVEYDEEWEDFFYKVMGDFERNSIPPMKMNVDPIFLKLTLYLSKEREKIRKEIKKEMQSKIENQKKPVL